MICWKCGTEFDDPPMGRVAFRQTCDQCHSWLHCCKNCRNYSPGLPNDCKVPGTDYIADREASNLCEEFILLERAPEIKGDPNEAAKKLFKDDDPTTEKKSFDDLFSS